jgi:hypothetical protein
MEIGLGYILAYDPGNGTIDIRTMDGTTYNSLAFDSSLAFYCTPVLPILRADAAGAMRAVKIGSFVMFAKFNDSNIRIIRIFNDDQDILQNYSGHASRPVHGYIQDTLIAMLQDGEALIQAPGRIVETTPDIFERKMGSWMLFKNSGDAILSNADSSCEMWVSNTGQWEVTAAKYRLHGADTEIQEDDSGDLHFLAGAQRGQPVELVMSSTDGSAALTTGDSSMVITPDDYSLSAGVMNLFAGNELNLSAAAFTLAVSSLDASANTVDVVGTEYIAASAPQINITAGVTATVEAGQAVIVNSPAVIVTAAKNIAQMDQQGTTLTLDKDTEMTVIIGDAKLTISKDGVVLIPPAGKTVGVGDGANLGVWMEGGTALDSKAGAVVFNPLGFSTLLKVAG